MESVLIFLIVTGILIFLIVIRSEFLKKFDVLNKNLHTIHKQVKLLQQSDPEEKTNVAAYTSLTDVPVKDNSLDLSSQRPVVETVKKQEPLKQPETEKPKTVETEKPKPVELHKTAETQKPVQEKIVVKEEKTEQQKETKPEIQTVKPGISKPATDFEKLIGENWLNKIGIGILVIGIGFFVKYAIDQNWIGEWGRLFIGIGAAFLMVGIAHWLRKKYHAFSSVLIGGGIATLYFTISIGYHDYKLFTQPVAFAIMTSITLFSVLMSVWYGRRELAIIGLIGGFTAPFMIAGETNNAGAFFTYIVILNSGMLILSFFKKWIELNRLAFIFSSVYLMSWILMNNLNVPRNFNIALTFLIIFFFQFLTMNLTYNLVKKIKFNSWEFIHLLSISGLFYGAILYILYAGDHGDLKGVFTIALTTLFAILTIALKRIPQTDNNLIFLISGKAVTFLTLTVFMEFDGHYTTLFWALEAVVLYWIGLKSKMKLLKNTSLIVTGIATISLFVVWSQNYQMSTTLLPAITNTAFATGSFVLLCYGALIYLLRKDREETNLMGIGSNNFSIIMQYWFFIAMYLVLLLELIHQGQRILHNDAANLVIWLFHLVYLSVALTLSNWKGSTFVKQLFFAIGIVAMALYVVIGNYFVIGIRDDLFTNNTLSFFYTSHFIIPVLFLGMFYLMQKMLVRFSEDVRHRHFFLTFGSLFILYLVCAEMDHIAVHQSAGSIGEKASVLRHTQVAGYTIVWGIYSFLMMIFGMRKKAKMIRVFALIAFSITLFKLFAFDIRNISEGGKIVAFILLGVMLLVISFLYQKLKKIIVDGEVGSGNDS